MKTFKEFLTETMALERTQKNISISHLKAFTKNAKEVRYIIDRNNHMHAAAADKRIHMDISDEAGAPDDEQIRGYIQHKNGKFTHHVSYKTATADMGGSNTYKGIKHPLLTKLEKAGVLRSKLPLEFEW